MSARCGSSIVCCFKHVHIAITRLNTIGSGVLIGNWKVHSTPNPSVQSLQTVVQLADSLMKLKAARRA